MSIDWSQVAEELFQLAEDVLEEDEELSEEYVNAARLIQETLCVDEADDDGTSMVDRARRDGRGGDEE